MYNSWMYSQPVFFYQLPPPWQSSLRWGRFLLDLQTQLICLLITLLHFSAHLLRCLCKCINLLKEKLMLPNILSFGIQMRKLWHPKWVTITVSISTWDELGYIPIPICTKYLINCIVISEHINTICSYLSCIGIAYTYLLRILQIQMIWKHSSHSKRNSHIYEVAIWGRNMRSRYEVAIWGHGC